MSINGKQINNLWNIHTVKLFIAISKINMERICRTKRLQNYNFYIKFINLKSNKVYFGVYKYVV